MKVTEKIHAIRHPFRLSLGDGRSTERLVDSYLILGKSLYLIDTGVAATAPILLDYIRNLGRSPEEISHVLLTHSHPDHIGGLAAIRKAAPQALVAVHPAERSWVENIQIQYQARPIPNLFELVERGVPVDLDLRDGVVFSLEDEITVKVIETPGHSQGSVSFLFEEEDALFTGDGVPAAGSIPIYVDPAASLASLSKLKRLPELHVLLSSWDDPIFAERIGAVMTEGVRYIERIDSLVKEIDATNPDQPLEELTRLVLERLGIRLPMLFHMVQATFAGHRVSLKA